MLALIDTAALFAPLAASLCGVVAVAVAVNGVHQFARNYNRRQRLIERGGLQAF